MTVSFTYGIVFFFFFVFVRMTKANGVISTRAHTEHFGWLMEVGSFYVLHLIMSDQQKV